ncbi:ATP-binding cassette domain-containing protein [bacterium]|nr:ATP-binding cassette domain-containing protein [bacterium]
MVLRKSILETNELFHRFGEECTLSFPDLSLSTGEVVCLLGESGCGKSTLLRILAGAMKPTAGAVTRHVPLAQVALLDQEQALLPWLSVSENITFFDRLLGRQTDAIPSVASLLHAVELEEYGARHPQELSGGQRQRVALLQVLWRSPRVLLLDEPLSKLDPYLRIRIGGFLKQWAEDRGATILWVTHQVEEAVEFADRILLLERRGASMAFLEYHAGASHRRREVFDELRSRLFRRMPVGIPA